MSKGTEHFDFTKCSSSSDHGLEDIGHFLQRHTSTGSGIGHCPAKQHLLDTKSFFTANELTRSHRMLRSRSENLRKRFLGREREVSDMSVPPGSLSVVEEAAGAEEVDDDVLDDE
jgi:hypothetical protein